MAERIKRTAVDALEEILVAFPGEKLYVARATLEAATQQTRRYERRLQVALGRVTELENHLAMSGEDMEPVT